jgi:hypothetical protein
MPSHTVTQGECISSIAQDYGFFWETLWNHSENQQLKQLRQNPNVLFPGDIVFVPELTVREESAASEQCHRFRLKGVPAKLRLRVMGTPEEIEPEPRETVEQRRGGRELVIESEAPQSESTEDEPRTDVPFVLEIDGVVLSEGTTDGDGYLEVEIPPNAREGRLIVERGTERELVIPLQLGGLDPIDTISGVKQRLHNLGIGPGELNDVEDEGLSSALRWFQERHGLEVTGSLDQATRDALRDAHGS